MEKIYLLLLILSTGVILILTFWVIWLRAGWKKAYLEINMKNINIKMFMKESPECILAAFKKIPDDRWEEYRHSFGTYVKETVTDMQSLQDLVSQVHGMFDDFDQRSDMYRLIHGEEGLNLSLDLLGKIYFDCLMAGETGSLRAAKTKNFINDALNYFSSKRPLVREHIMKEFANFIDSQASDDDKVIARSAKIKFERDKMWIIQVEK